MSVPASEQGHSLFPTVIFDFDGTLADTLGVAVEIVNGLAPNFGYKKIIPQDIPRLRTLTMRELLKEFDISMLVLPRIVKTVHKELNMRMQEVRPFPEMIEVWGSLRQMGVTLGVGTSNTKRNVLAFFSHHKFAECDFIVSSSGIFGKGRILKGILRERGIAPTDALYVGDEVRDIEAARDAGMRIVSVTWGYNAREALAACRPDYLIDHPRELVAVIDSILTQKG